MAKHKAFCSWSGGKDSALALHRVRLHNVCRVEKLVTNITQHNNRVTMHGVPLALVQRQAQAIGLPLQTIGLPFQPGNPEYEAATHAALAQLAQEGYTHGVFGDIFLEDLKAYREQQLAAFGMQAVFPLWGMESHAVVQALFDEGFRAIVVCVNGALRDASFVGSTVDTKFIQALPPGVDPCGENGEYHTFVFDSPYFSQPVSFKKGDVYLQQYPSPVSGAGGITTVDFWLCDLQPVEG